MALPLLLGIAHGVSDAAAGLMVMRIILEGVTLRGSLLILLYNGLAFACQPLAGLLLDRWGVPALGSAVGLFLIAAGCVGFLLNPAPGIALAGIGSALFHAGGGSLSIRVAPNRAFAPGVFTSFGVVGLSIGSQLAYSLSWSVVWGFAFVLSGLATVIVLWRRNARVKNFVNAKEFEHYLSTQNWIIIIIIIIVLSIAVALRSLVWTGVYSSFQLKAQLLLWLAVAAGAGKLLGGFLADWAGWLRFSIVALGIAVVFLFLGGTHFPSLLVGVFFLQSVTPLSVAALGKMMPRMPALAASLALGVAIIVGGLPFFILSPGWFGREVVIVALALSAVGYTWGLRRTTFPADAI